jgi:hypothetical protein
VVIAKGIDASRGMGIHGHVELSGVSISGDTNVTDAV